LNQLNFIYGRGWDQNDWAVKKFPNNEQLNILFEKKSVFFKRIDGHAVIVNEHLLNIAKDVLTPFQNTSYIESKNGKMTGILFDNAMDAVEKLLPKISNAAMIYNIF
jgi:predicted amidohydrolase YtcJ